MKIQCDVCSKDEASVFCTADEAALCDACDHRVHHANKLASKHQRFSLLHPSSKSFPLCDVCQDKRAFLFCQQDRAILCRDCDGPIHRANEHTQKHNRYLLTGVKLSATSTLYISSASSNSSSVSNSADIVPDSKSTPYQQQQPSIKNNKPAPATVCQSSKSNPLKNLSFSNAAVNKSGDFVNNNNNILLTSEGIGLTSSISEYLMETLPGWHVEDFLDSPTTTSGFCKADDGMLPFLDTDFDATEMSSFSSEGFRVWVPQSSPSPLNSSLQFYYPQIGGQNGLLKEAKEANTNTNNNKNRWSRVDDAFTVPQISPPSAGSKRSRPLW